MAFKGGESTALSPTWAALAPGPSAHSTLATPASLHLESLLESLLPPRSSPCGDAPTGFSSAGVLPEACVADGVPPMSSFWVASTPRPTLGRGICWR